MLRREKIKYAVQALLFLTMVSYLFYGTLWPMLFMLPLAGVYVKRCVSQHRQKEQDKLAEEFKEGMIAVSFSLSTGYSVENAFREAVKEMIGLYGRESEIVAAFQQVCNRLSRNENIEQILYEFARQSGVEDIEYFAEVFGYAKRSGGDLISISRNTAATIRDKNEVRKEIATIISGKQMEHRVMSVVPFGMILYLKLASPEFIEPMYGNPAGVMIMTAALLLYCGAYVLGEKMIQIRV